MVQEIHNPTAEIDFRPSQESMASNTSSSFTKRPQEASESPMPASSQAKKLKPSQQPAKSAFEEQLEIFEKAGGVGVCKDHPSQCLCRGSRSCPTSNSLSNAYIITLDGVAENYENAWPRPPLLQTDRSPLSKLHSWHCYTPVWSLHRTAVSLPTNRRRRLCWKCSQAYLQSSQYSRAILDPNVWCY